MLKYPSGATGKGGDRNEAETPFRPSGVVHDEATPGAQRPLELAQIGVGVALIEVDETPERPDHVDR